MHVMTRHLKGQSSLNEGECLNANSVLKGWQINLFELHPIAIAFGKRQKLIETFTSRTFTFLFKLPNDCNFLFSHSYRKRRYFFTSEPMVDRQHITVSFLLFKFRFKQQWFTVSFLLFQFRFFLQVYTFCTFTFLFQLQNVCLFTWEPHCIVGADCWVCFFVSLLLF